jgi:hypothetical protein
MLFCSEAMLAVEERDERGDKRQWDEDEKNKNK